MSEISRKGVGDYVDGVVKNFYSTPTIQAGEFVTGTIGQNTYFNTDVYIRENDEYIRGVQEVYNNPSQVLISSRTKLMLYDIPQRKVLSTYTYSFTDARFLEYKILPLEQNYYLVFVPRNYPNYNIFLMRIENNQIVHKSSALGNVSSEIVSLSDLIQLSQTRACIFYTNNVGVAQRIDFTISVIDAGGVEWLYNTVRVSGLSELTLPAGWTFYTAYKIDNFHTGIFYLKSGSAISYYKITAAGNVGAPWGDSSASAGANHLVKIINLANLPDSNISSRTNTNVMCIFSNNNSYADRFTYYGVYATFNNSSSPNTFYKPRIELNRGFGNYISTENSKTLRTFLTGNLLYMAYDNISGVVSILNQTYPYVTVGYLQDRQDRFYTHLTTFSTDDTFSTNIPLYLFAYKNEYSIPYHPKSSDPTIRIYELILYVNNEYVDNISGFSLTPPFTQGSANAITLKCSPIYADFAIE